MQWPLLTSKSIWQWWTSRTACHTLPPPPPPPMMAFNDIFALKYSFTLKSINYFFWHPPLYFPLPIQKKKEQNFATHLIMFQSKHLLIQYINSPHGHRLTSQNTQLWFQSNASDTNPCHQSSICTKSKPTPRCCLLFEPISMNAHTSGVVILLMMPASSRWRIRWV